MREFADHVRKGRVDDLKAAVAYGLSRRNCLLVAVKGKDARALSQKREQRAGMSAAAERRVDINAVGAREHFLRRFTCENRAVHKGLRLRCALS